MVPLHKLIAVKGLWQQVWRDPTLFVNIYVFLQIRLKTKHPADLNSNATHTDKKYFPSVQRFEPESQG